MSDTTPNDATNGSNQDDIAHTSASAPGPRTARGSDAGKVRPDDVIQFRLGQLLILLAETRERRPLDVERLSVTEFMAANPYLVLTRADELERRRLRNAGFSEHSLIYASPGQRFATRRERVMHDLAVLISYALIRIQSTDGRRTFTVTDAGVATADALSSVYADAYRASVAVIAPRIAALNDTALRRKLGDWLRADPLLFDILDVTRLDPLTAAVS